MYDIFAISLNTFNQSNWNKIKEKYPTAILCENVKSFSEIANKSFTKMFWVIWDNILFTDNLDLNEYRATRWDDQYIHVFRNGKVFDGICLFPKTINVTDKELFNRFFLNRKEVDIQATVPEPYEKIHIDNYDDYQFKINEVQSEFVWVIPSNVIPEFDFDYQIPYWDKDTIHIFRNVEFFDGIFLQYTNKIVTNKEIEYRFFVKKKEVDVNASRPIVNPRDIVFISYNEPNAEENWERLKNRFPSAKRVDGVEGIHQAHIEAARMADTDMFFVVDADAKVLEGFNFDYRVEEWNKDAVHVWQSINPINGLIYGYGGVKLLPKEATLNMDLEKPDMTTSIATKFKCVTTVSNITNFNTDPFNTWKSAFRECVKLSSKTIARQDDKETEERLQKWCTVGANRNYGNYAIKGALAGKDYGEQHKESPEKLRLINDFKWLKEKFNEI